MGVVNAFNFLVLKAAAAAAVVVVVTGVCQRFEPTKLKKKCFYSYSSKLIWVKSIKKQNISLHCIAEFDCLRFASKFLVIYVEKERERERKG